MALDIRADVQCSLGTLINGSLADNYLQANGLIRTRGEVVLDGTQTPAVGTQVTFTYTKNGSTYTLPRVLRVLSSFADPFRRTTTVQLGCKLTYLENRKPPVENPNSRDENSDVPCSVYLQATLPISAQYIFEQCLTALDLTSAPIPLTSKFSVEEFDLTPGYIQVMSDLLQSEGYIGYLDSTETLQFIQLTEAAGTGPVLTAADVIDLGPIGSGDLPGESVVVRWDNLRLLAPEDLYGDDYLMRSWEVEEVFGAPVEVSVSYTDDEGDTITGEDVFYPYSFTATRYDVWDRKIESVSLNQTSSAEVNNRWASDAFKKGGVNWNAATNRVTVETVEYELYATPANTIDLLGIQDLGNSPTAIKQALATSAESHSGPADLCKEQPPDGYDVVKSQTTINYFSELELAGSLNLDSYISDGGVLASFDTTATWVDSKVVVEYDTDTTSGVSKTLTKRWISRSQTVAGQQDLATKVQDLDTANLSSSIDSLLTTAGITVYQGAIVGLHTQRQYGLQQRPSAADRNNTANRKPQISESKAELTWITGSTTSTAVTEFTLPYAPDDEISWDATTETFSSTPSDAPQKALNYGRIQNALLLGHRNGVSLQLTPEQMPPTPFDPLYLEVLGITASYRVNGTSWAFDSNGIVVSADALLWGAVSAEAGTDLGSSWIPLAPGTTSLPAPYTPTTGTPNSETGVTYDAVITPTAVLPPYIESVSVEGATRSTAAISDYPYATQLPAVTTTPVTRTTATTSTVVGPYITAPITLSLGEYSVEVPSAGPVTKTRIIAISLKADAKQLADPISTYGITASPYIKFQRTKSTGMVALSNPATLPVYRTSAAAFSPDGTRMAYLHGAKSGLTNVFLQWYTVNNYTFTAQTAPTDQPGGTGTLAFSHSGQYLMTTQIYTSPYCDLYRVTSTGFTRATTTPLNPAPSSALRAFKWSRDDRYIFAVGGSDLYVYERNGEQFDQVTTVTLPSAAYSVAVSPTTDRVVVGTLSSPYVYEYTFANNTLTATGTSIAYTSRPLQAAFSPTGKYLALGNTSGAGLKIFRFDGTSYSATNTSGVSFLATTPLSESLSWGEDDRYIFGQFSSTAQSYKYNSATDRFDLVSGGVFTGTRYADNSGGQWPLPALVRALAADTTTTLTITASNNVYSFDPNNPRLYQNTNALPRLGVAAATTYTGWDLLFDSDIDDGTVAVTLPFSVTIGGVANTLAYVGSNSHITFGEAYAGVSYYNFPEVPKINIWHGDYSMQRVYKKAGADYVILRYEGYPDTTGGVAGSSTIIWEIVFTAPDPDTGDQVIEFRMGDNEAVTDYWWWYDYVQICSATAVLGSSDDYPDVVHKSSIYTSDSTGNAWAVTHRASLLAI
ncbi:MAG: TolB family protein [Candidatus Limnocylindrus sp.]